ncbi:MAG: helix-hairpin-helix domain-containing protein, partial [Myxococcota bacterium]
LLSSTVEEKAAAPTCCEVPVEVVESVGTRVGCRGDADLLRCGGLIAGDRVVLEAAQCVVVRHGMSAGLRLLQGLGLDVNRASADELQLIDGVGPALAEAIAHYRRENGPFRHVEGLLRVKGIGEATLERIRPSLTVLGSDDTNGASAP